MMPLLQTLLLHVMGVVLVFPVVLLLVLLVVDGSGPDIPGKFNDPLTKSGLME